MTSEISTRFDTPAFPIALEDWKRIHALSGAAEEELAGMAETLREKLSVLSPEETETLLGDADFVSIVPFFQASLIRGWHARKT